MPQFENIDGSWLAAGAILALGIGAAVVKSRSPRGASNAKLAEVPWSELEQDTTWQPGHHGPSQTLTFTDESGTHTVILSAGGRDNIEVFQQKGTKSTIRHPGSATVTYVLTTNTGLGYVGLEAFEGDEKLGEGVFLQNDWSIEEVLGKKGLDLQSKTIVQRLIPYLPY